MTKQANDKTPKKDVNTESAEDDLASIRLNPSIVDGVLVKPLWDTVPLRKPLKTDFFRVHPEHFFDTALVEMKEEGEMYFVTPNVNQMLNQAGDFVRAVRLRYCVNRQGTPFIWPLKLPREDNRKDNWCRSAMDAAKLAESSWIRIAANRQLGAYQTFEAQVALSEPEWPNETWEKMLQAAVRNSIIKTADHPIVRQLLGLS